MTDKLTCSAIYQKPDGTRKQVIGWYESRETVRRVVEMLNPTYRVVEYLTLGEVSDLERGIRS